MSSCYRILIKTSVYSWATHLSIWQRTDTQQSTFERKIRKAYIYYKSIISWTFPSVRHHIPKTISHRKNLNNNIIWTKTKKNSPKWNCHLLIIIVKCSSGKPATKVHHPEFFGKLKIYFQSFIRIKSKIKRNCVLLVREIREKWHCLELSAIMGPVLYCALFMSHCLLYIRLY